MVIKEAAVMATPGSTRVQIMAWVPVTVKMLDLGLGGGGGGSGREGVWGRWEQGGRRRRGRT